MKKNERLSKAIAYLKMQGLVESQVDAAKKMNATESTMSSAINGNERYLSDKFMRRFNKAFGNIFSLEWLINGVGDMMCSSCADVNNIYESTIQTNVQGDNSTNTQVIENHKAELALKEKEIELLKRQLEFYKEQVEYYKNK